MDSYKKNSYKKTECKGTHFRHIETGNACLSYPLGKYLFKVNMKGTRTIYLGIVVII